jgi:NAD(P)-dependent dehydrogenase (short-subunit alcohol dehydrogenase family)/acyl carrier protein
VAEAVPAASSDRVSDVMARYQTVMQRFLETERAVMLTYLGAPRSAVDAPAAPQPQLPAPAALPRVASPPPVAPQVAPAAPQAAPAPAPVEVRPPSAFEPPGNGHVVLSAEDIKERLLAIVSERTGYPEEMLGLDVDLEADLGIDSIKRVEIAGTLTQTIALPDGAIDIEELTASRTLQQVIAVLEAALSPATAAETGGEAAEEGRLAEVPGEHRPFEHGPAGTERTGRFLLQAASAPAITATAGLAGSGTVVIVDDETGVGEALAGALERRGERTVRLDPARWPADADAAARLAERIRSEGAGAKALVHLGALGGQSRDAGLGVLLLVSQALREDLEAAGTAGGAAVLGATRLGGSFGVQDAVPDGDAAQGAIPGFLKTLAEEWPAVRVKAVDLSEPPDVAAGQLLDELMAADDLVEVGYRGGERTQLTLASAPLDDRVEEGSIDANSVLLITGGARGITAEAALSLAQQHRPTLMLVGRTPPGPEEEGDTAGVTELRDLRIAFIERRRRVHADVTPALVEEDCRRLLRGREVRDNLARLRATGARVEYVTCDVRDADAFGALIDGVYERYGRIDGVIHGAGVIEDRLVRDKTLDSLERVMATKAGSARTLAEKLRPESLRFLVLFSSVSGRFGNRGQADYGAASEVLNKLAQELDRRWPTRVVSINWGPWRTTGMVSPEVERQFSGRGVVSIPVELGCQTLQEELRRGRKGETEIVVTVATRGAQPLLTAATDLSRTAEGGLVALRRFHLEHDLYFDHHRVDGNPVLPFAVAMELMAEAAAEARPGARVAGLRDVRVLQGVVVDERDGTEVRIAARPTSSDAELEVTITEPDSGRGHYRALVEVRAPGGEDGEVPDMPEPLPDLPPFPMSVDDAYRDLLFHGPLFQGIVAIEGMDGRGAVSLLRPSDPSDHLTGAGVSEWLLDPVLLDCALQVHVVWARLHWDVTLLPAELRAHQRFVAHVRAELPEGGLVRHEFRVRRDSESPLCRADHWFYLPDGRLLGTLEDMLGVGTAALNRLAAAGA